jgi:hypothetical protein
MTVTAAQEEATVVKTSLSPPVDPPPLLFEPEVLVADGRTVPLPVAVTIHEHTDEMTAG